MHRILMVANADPIKMSPYIIRATSRKFKLLYDRKDGIWHSLWKKLHPANVQKLPWGEMRVRCSAWIRTRVLDSMSKILPHDFCPKYTQPKTSIHQECGALRWDVDTSLRLSTDTTRLPEGVCHKCHTTVWTSHYFGVCCDVCI